jgi:hypothetical protein
MHREHIKTALVVRDVELGFEDGLDELCSRTAF